MPLNIALWISQGLLAAIFVASGVAKSSMSKPHLIETGQTGVAPYPVPFIRVVGALEILAALGLVLPRLVNVAPLLTPIAAAGLAAIMGGAAFSHLSIHEPKQVFVVNIPLFLLCLFVVLGRLIAP
jgi:uncharacterized membrane protein YphA (DoxX/SURF4 family)